MRDFSRLRKPLTEVKYLNAENVDRYRCIMRLFYEANEQFRMWMYQEEVYSKMCEDPYFSAYKEEMCEQDLRALTEWGNLIAVQDTRNITSLNEFLNKKYRYQISEYSIEIEKLLLHLENLRLEGASLEPSLMERIRERLGQFSEVVKEDIQDVGAWWRDLMSDFQRLNDNYKNYIRELKSVKAEELMQSREFILFKDKLVEYLHGFIHGLQENVGSIESLLREIPPEEKDVLFSKITAYELSIPRIDFVLTEGEILERERGRFDSLYHWFCDGENISEAQRLFDETNQIIRRITRYAASLAEKNSFSANRREEYRKLATLFMQCEDLSSAHKMSSMVFGIEKPKHYKALKERETESQNISVYEEEAAELRLKPRVRTYREKSNRTVIRAFHEEKAKVRSLMMEQMQEDRRKISSLEQDGKIRFSTLPVIEARVREILLNWISDALSKYGRGKTEDGRSFSLHLLGGKTIVHCEDGNFTMPDMELRFDGRARDTDQQTLGFEVGR